MYYPIKAIRDKVFRDYSSGKFQSESSYIGNSKVFGLTFGVLHHKTILIRYSATYHYPMPIHPF